MKTAASIEDTDVEGIADGVFAAGLPHYLTADRSTVSWSRSRPKASLPVARPRRPDLLSVGELVAGNFEVRTLLGSGGMGQVWEAHDRALDRMVAIKVAWPHLRGESLRREARVQAAFRHPGLVTAHALLRDGERDLLVMELVRGVLLSHLMQSSGRLSLDEALGVLLPLCETLEVLHANGLAHGDLKPSNVMITAEQRIVLLDFGIVRIERVEQGDRDAGPISGSPHFMAPEVIRGNVRRGEAHLVDLYSLGVLAFALLTGGPPFDDDDPVEVLVKQIESPAPSLAEARPDLPPPLCELVAHMLSKNPSERPPQIEAIGDALRALVRSRGPGAKRRRLRR